MSDPESDPELTELLTDLTRTLRELEREVEPEKPDGPRLPTPSELSRFASEVAIPGLILMLRTNIRALQLLRRALRLADGRDPSPDGAVTEARSRAEKVGRASLSQLDDVLSDLQSSLEARPTDDEASELVSRARKLREEVQEEIQQDGAEFSPENGDGTATDDSSEAVSIDIESELQSLKDNIDEAEDDDGDEAGTDGDEAGTDGDDEDGGSDQS